MSENPQSQIEIRREVEDQISQQLSECEIRRQLLVERLQYRSTGSLLVAWQLKTPTGNLSSKAFVETR